MSKVYSFRLNDENPREAQAREVIEAWVREGYSLRHVIVEALLDYKQEKTNYIEYCFVLEQIQDLIDGYNKTDEKPIPQQSLSSTFISGVKRSMQKGIQT